MFENKFGNIGSFNPLGPRDFHPPAATTAMYNDLSHFLYAIPGAFDQFTGIHSTRQCRLQLVFTFIYAFQLVAFARDAEMQRVSKYLRPLRRRRRRRWVA